FIRPISMGALKELIKGWGYQIDNNVSSKLNLFTNSVGLTLTKEQFHQLWLLREKVTVIRNRYWKIFKFDSEKLANLGIDELKARLLDSLKDGFGNEDEFRLSVDLLNDDEFYVVLHSRGAPRMIEEFDEGMKIIHPVQKIRLILEKNGYARLNGGAPVQYEKFLSAIEKALGANLRPLQIFSYVLRDFVHNTSPIRRISLVCPREMGGFSGVERITVEGPDVVRGMDDLRSRQEVLFNFDGLSKLGAWTKVDAKMVKLDVKGNVQISDEKMKKHVLNFFE
ncbi:MAG: hypothetical protein ACXQS8_03325, partial [Candidatus Helarchaeales archaeon]